MALNQIYKYSEGKTRERQVPAATKSGDPLLVNARPAVALTSRGDVTVTQALPNGTSITFPAGGIGVAADSATLAFDGTFEFAVAGAVTGTGQDVPVYITATTPPTLTLTASTNTLYGATDYPKGYTKSAGRAPVRIGA